MRVNKLMINKLMKDAKKMDMEDFVAHAMKYGMKKSDAYGMWDDMNPYDDDHIEPFSDDDYDEFGVRHSTSFNMPESEEKSYVCVHAKKGKHECKATSSYGAAKKAAEHWGLKSTAGIDAHLADEKKTATESMLRSVVKELTEAEFDEAAGEKDACYHKVKSRYKVWPSAYASGALVKCRKVGAANWGKSKK